MRRLFPGKSRFGEFLGEYALATGKRCLIVEDCGVPEYKVSAENDRGGKLTIVTGDRSRALRHAELFRQRGQFDEIMIEVGGRQFMEPFLENIP